MPFATGKRQWHPASGGPEEVSDAWRDRGDCGVWQPRSWEHAIEREHDFDRDFDYVHDNPVKHRRVTCPRDWGPSTFHP